MANSVLASLSSRTTTQAAQASDQGTKGTATITGQYLYDRFVEKNDGDITLLGLVRQAVGQVDVQSWKKALKDMVEIAGQKGEAQKKTAQNHQTVLRTAYGALRFAADELRKLGAGDNTGYQMMRVVGKQALEAKGIKWDGTKKLDDEQSTMQRQTKEAQRALIAVQKENPQQVGESFGDWMARIQDIVEEQLAKNAQVKAQERIEELAEKVFKMCGDDFWQVMDVLDRRIKEKSLPSNEGSEQSATAEGEQAQAEQQEEVHA